MLIVFQLTKVDLHYVFENLKLINVGGFKDISIYLHSFTTWYLIDATPFLLEITANTVVVVSYNVIMTYAEVL